MSQSHIQTEPVSWLWSHTYCLNEVWFTHCWWLSPHMFPCSDGVKTRMCVCVCVGAAGRLSSSVCCWEGWQARLRARLSLSAPNTCVQSEMLWKDVWRYPCASCRMDMSYDITPARSSALIKWQMLFCASRILPSHNLFFSASFSSTLTFAKFTTDSTIQKSKLSEHSECFAPWRKTLNQLSVCVCVYVLVNVRLRDVRISMETDINRAVFGLLALAVGFVQWEERCGELTFISAFGSLTLPRCGPAGAGANLWSWGPNAQRLKRIV